MQILNRQNQQNMRTLHEVTSQFNAGAIQPISQCTEQCALHFIVTINIALVIATYIGPSMINITLANQLFWSRRLTWGYRSNLSTGCCVSQWWLCNNVGCILLERTASKTGVFLYSLWHMTTCIPLVHSPYFLVCSSKITQLHICTQVTQN